jgi:hypothetical protein
MQPSALAGILGWLSPKKIMSHTPLLLLDRACRYRLQAARAREVARHVRSAGVALSLFDLARTLEHKALRLERLSAATALRHPQDAEADPFDDHRMAG